MRVQQKRIWSYSLVTVQIAMTSLLTIVLLREIDWSGMESLWANLQWASILLSFCFLLVSHMIGIARWRCFLPKQARLYKQLLTYYCAGLFYNNFLPTGIGGDGVRAALLCKDTGAANAFASVGFDRLIGFVGLGILLAIGLQFGPPPQMTMGMWQSYQNQPTAWLIIALAGIGIIALLFLAVKRQRRFVPRLARPDPAIDEQGVAAPKSSMRHLPALSAGLGLSFIYQLGIVAAHWAVIRALNIEVPLVAAVWLVLFGSISLLLPISFNGLGLQEGVYVIVLSHYGVPFTAALGVALVVRFLMVLFSLLGGVISLGALPLRLASGSLLFTRHRKRRLK